MRQTLSKRKERLINAEARDILFTDEDLPDDDLDEDADEHDELSEMEHAALLLDDRSAVEDLLRQAEALPEDTKSRHLRKTLKELQEAGYKQVMVFTQFTDTLDFVRVELLKATDLKVLWFLWSGWGNCSRRWSLEQDQPG